MGRLSACLASLALALVLAGCNQEVGADLTQGERAPFGTATDTNIGFMTGELEYGMALAERFAAEVPTTITFAFNSAQLDEQARAVLRQQAHFILAFPEVRFSVYGHTDLVGSAAYNRRLGERRAEAAVAFLVSQGVERSRLDALVSLGETAPVVDTATRERRNRRTVTEVTGFVQSHPLVLDGEYARIVYRAYVGGS